MIKIYKIYKFIQRSLSDPLITGNFSTYSSCGEKGSLLLYVPCSFKQWVKFFFNFKSFIFIKDDYHMMYRDHRLVHQSLAPSYKCISVRMDGSAMDIPGIKNALIDYFIKNPSEFTKRVNTIYTTNI